MAGSVQGVTESTGTSDVGPSSQSGSTATTRDGHDTSTSGDVGESETSADDETTTSDPSNSTGNDTSDDDPTGNPGVDQDGDGIPDDFDPFPNDPDLPGTVIPGLIYAHSSNVLWTMGVNAPYPLELVGPFGFQSHGGQMTDVAIDQWGVLYGVTFNDLFVCHPQQATCYRLAGLPQSFNGLTVIPAGFIDADKEVLVAIANNGSWHRVDLVGPQMAQLMQIGSYGGYTSSGDAFSILGVGTYAAVNKSGVTHDIIAQVNPANGNVMSEVATVTGYNSIFGLAGWEGSIFAYDASSAVLRISPNNGQVQVIHAFTGVAWWGAGVGTLLPQ